MFKRIFLASLLLGCLSLSGSGAQSHSLILQAGSFIGILVSLVVLFIFLKMISKSMGCFPSFLILCAITVFIMYAFGMLNNGISGIPDAIQVFLGQKQEAKQTDPVQALIQQAQMNAVNQSAAIQNNTATPAFQSPEQSAPIMKPQLPAPTENSAVSTTQPVVMGENFSSEGIVAPDLGIEEEIALEKIQTISTNESQPIKEQQAEVQNLQQGQVQENNPVNLLENLPLLYGPAKVLTADTISVRGRRVVLFGIDGPELSQTCTNKRGQSYSCGKEAALWLKDWLASHEVQCRIMQEDSKGTLLGVCSLGEYDIAAALVNEGLAFAKTSMSEIYVPYQLQAQNNKKGLWSGSFYMPWDWRKIQVQKPRIKIIKKKAKKKSLLDL